VQSSGYGFQIELKYRAIKKGFTIKEIPIVFEDRRVGQSKMSRKIFLEAIRMVWKLRFTV
jgi:dolichol-phosphate mannosyltransferase